MCQALWKSCGRIWTPRPRRRPSGPTLPEAIASRFSPAGKVKTPTRRIRIPLVGASSFVTDTSGVRRQVGGELGEGFMRQGERDLPPRPALSRGLPAAHAGAAALEQHFVVEQVFAALLRRGAAEQGRVAPG